MDEHIVITEAWWFVAGILEASCKLFGVRLVRIVKQSNGFAATVQRGDEVLGTFAITGDSETTDLHISPRSGSDTYWDAVLGLLIQFKSAATAHRRSFYATTADGAIERYYRSKARNSRITLKGIADLTGFNYDYLRRVRRKYDASGKWGSKATDKRGDTR